MQGELSGSEAFDSDNHDGLLGLSNEIQVSLEYDEAEVRKGNNKSFCVCFDESVSLVEIPLASRYSKSTRERLWTSSEETEASMERNRKEFREDGWDWRTATEEDDFVLCPSNGVLVHPASFKRHGKGSNYKPPKEKSKGKQQRRKGK